MNGVPSSPISFKPRVSNISLLNKAQMIRLRVWLKNFEVGDRLSLVCEANKFTPLTEGYELQPEDQASPWKGLWKGEIMANPSQLDGKGYLHCKYVLTKRDGTHVWEKFEPHRRIYGKEPEKLFYVKFDDQLWFMNTCPLCYHTFNEEPILCSNPKEIHALDIDCFISCLTLSIQKGSSEVACVSCKFTYPENSWRDKIPNDLRKLHERVKLQEQGHTVYLCPNNRCDYYTSSPAPNLPAREKSISPPSSPLAPSSSIRSEADFPPILECEKCATCWCSKCQKSVENRTCRICNEGLFDCLKDIMESLANAAGRKCPKCKLLGRKEPNDCTYVTCLCGAYFCYVCGKDESEVDSSVSDVSRDRLVGHSAEWETIPTRCPKYLTDLRSKNKNWPSDAEKLQNRWHREQAMERLESIQRRHGERWRRLMDLDSELSLAVNKIMEKCRVPPEEPKKKEGKK